MTARAPKLPAAAVVRVVLLAWMATGTPALADDPVPEGYRTVVTPSRSTANDFDVGRMVEVVSPDEIAEGQPADGPAALDRLPGVTAQRTNRGAGAPILRGLIGPQNLILVDGLRFNLTTFRTGPNQYAALIDLLALESMEVVLGPGSLRYGSDAMGGVVNYRILGLPSDDGPMARVALRYATADAAREGSALIGGRSGDVAGWVGGSLRVHGDLRVGDGERLPLSRYDAADWRARVSVDLPDGWELRGSYLGGKLSDAPRTDQLSLGSVRMYDDTDHFLWLDALQRDRGDPSRELRFSVWYHRHVEIADRFRCPRDASGAVADRAACLTLRPPATTSMTRDDDAVDSIGGLALGRLHLLDDRLTVDAGLEGRVELVSSAGYAGSDEASLDTSARGQFSDGSTYAGIDGFVNVEGRPYVDPGTFELVVGGGGRISYVTASAPDVPKLGDVHYDFVGASFSAGVRALFGNRVNLFATWSQGFRAPNLQETTALGDTGSNFETPNPDLGPERSDTLDVGVKVALPWLSARATYFHAMLTDAIVRESALHQGLSEVDGKPVVRRVNADSAVYDGIEAALQTARVAGFSMFGNVSWTDGEVTAASGDSSTPRRLQPVRGLAGVRWEGQELGLYVSLFARFSGAADDLAPDDRTDLRICEDPANPGKALGDACEGTPGWTTLNAHVGFRPLPGLRIDAALENLTDARYRNHGSGIDEPGLDVRLQVRWEY